MASRFGITAAICLCLATAANAQVVRFETTMGDFDMVLNPTKNPVLQAHVDNMLKYVQEEKYRASWINRADTGFVLQMGGFYSHTRRPPPTIDSVRSVAAFDPVHGEPAAENPGLSNTVGTVSLALSGLPTGGTNQDSGTSSFFVNLTSNTFLDPDFTVFAAIPDMTVVNQIMALTTIDRTQDSNFGAEAGNLGFTDVPIQANGFQVFIKRAFVVDDAMTVAKDMAGVQSVMAQSLSSFGKSAETPSQQADEIIKGTVPVYSAGPPETFSSAGALPEPGSLMLALASFSTLAFFLRHRRRR
jgi:cyclophilin family peptidyl-prolyl cis-trans isomerase